MTLDNNSQIILFDPVCGFSRGHNYSTLIKYANWFKKNGYKKNEIWIAKGDCDPSITDITIKKKIPWLYEYFLPTQNKSLNAFLQRVLQRLNRCAVGRLRILNICLWPFSLLIHQINLYSMVVALRKVLKTAKTFKIFFPGADFYSILGLLYLARKGDICRKRRIILRLMGVMETAGCFPANKERVFLDALHSLLAFGLNITIIAETEKYASFLEKKLKIKVMVTHIPSPSFRGLGQCMQELTDKKLQTTLTLCALGGGRRDKGYFELVFFARELRKQFGNGVTLLVQCMSPKNTEYDALYELELVKAPNIVTLPAFLEEKELYSVIAFSDVMFLPYALSTYVLRGSAMLFDAISVKKIIIARSYVAFGDSINVAGLGFTFSTLEEFLVAIKTVINMSDRQKNTIFIHQKEYIIRMEDNLRSAIGGKEANMHIY